MVILAKVPPESVIFLQFPISIGLGNVSGQRELTRVELQRLATSSSLRCRLNLCYLAEQPGFLGLELSVSDNALFPQPGQLGQLICG